MMARAKNSSKCWETKALAAQVVSHRRNTCSYWNSKIRHKSGDDPSHNYDMTPPTKKVLLIVTSEASALTHLHTWPVLRNVHLRQGVVTLYTLPHIHTYLSHITHISYMHIPPTHAHTSHTCTHTYRTCSTHT